jgi:hypothetical protein
LVSLGRWGPASKRPLLASMAITRGG